jgi:hypothetical protein
MTRQISKPNIFWAPSLETARKIDDEDTVQSIETARYRFAASIADLERCYDEEASRLRAAFVARELGCDIHERSNRVAVLQLRSCGSQEEGAQIN